MRCFAGLLMTVTLAAIAAAELPNGDFEFEDAEMWKRFGAGVTPRRVPAPGWVRLGSPFSSREYEQIRLYLRIQTGIGTVCFDGPRIGDLPLVDPGFEQADGDRLVGWQQDNVGDTILVSDGSAIEGERCVCLHHEQEAISRVWQDVACRPDTEYEASVWVRTAGFRGAAYAEVYGLRDGQLGEIIWQSDHVSGMEELQLGRTILQVTSDEDGAGGLEQTLQAPPGRNLALTADLAAPLLVGGSLSVVVYAGDALLGQVRLDEPAGRWRHHRVVFQSPATGIITVRVEAQGQVGLAYVDNIGIADLDAVLTAASAAFVGAERNLPLLGPALFIRLPEPTPDLLLKGAQILGDRFARATDGAVALQSGEGTPQVTVTVDGEPTAPIRTWEDDQSYVLSSSESSGVRITAATVCGAFYGLMALPDLLDQTPEKNWVLLAARVEDRPALPFRGTYMAGLLRNRGERIAWCRRLAALRLNAIVIEDDIWWRLDNEADRKLAQEAFADFRSYGIEPIPELQSFGWAHLVLAIDPMCAEGTLVERERIKLSGAQPAALGHPNVLRTEATDIVVEDAQGIAYAEGRDYEVIDGVTQHVYRPDAEPYRIRRRPGSGIPDGATVFASYDYVSRVNSQNCPYCPSEPRVARIMTGAIRNTVQHLAPSAVHIGHDEPALMNSDRRCREAHKTNAQLLADDVWLLYNAAREIDPNVLLMMWADAVNPYHNGLQFPLDPTANAVSMLPEDLILNVWFYGPDQPAKQGADSLRFFGAQGFATTGSPWYDETCAKGWARVCYEARLRGEECLGVLYTSWGGKWGALEPCARSAWRSPVPPPSTPTGDQQE